MYDRSDVSDADATAALTAFKDWSNYLLVTTVAAGGWVSTQEQRDPAWTQPASLGLLTVSIIFGIFVLALVPLVAEQRNAGHSIYRTQVRVGILGAPVPLYMTQVCRPQHLTFILGIIVYAVGAAKVDWSSGSTWAGLASGIAAVVIVAIAQAPSKTVRLAAHNGP
jgi:hypothetical protein